MEDKYQWRYKTTYLEDELIGELLKIKKKKKSTLSKTMRELILDGLEYRNKIANGDWVKK